MSYLSHILLICFQEKMHRFLRGYLKMCLFILIIAQLSKGRSLILSTTSIGLKFYQLSN
ncbi:hypothetical protein YC2023_090549 [Brassica napus]